jgi:hypothetical protein
MQALINIADPETRTFAYNCLNSSDLALVRDGLALIEKIGARREDVPAIVRGIQQFEFLLFDPTIKSRIVSYSSASEDQIFQAILTCQSLGAQAEDALPMLEQMATKPRYPQSSTLQKAAQAAVDKIKGALAEGAPSSKVVPQPVAD